MSTPDTIARYILGAAIAQDPTVTSEGPWIPARLPDGAPLGFRLGRALLVAQVALNAGRPADAIAALRPYESTLILEGPGLVALRVYGRALMADGQLEAGLAQFDKLLQRRGLHASHPEHVVVHVWRARALAKAGQDRRGAEVGPAMPGAVEGCRCRSAAADRGKGGIREADGVMTRRRMTGERSVNRRVT